MSEIEQKERILEIIKLDKSRFMVEAKMYLLDELFAELDANKYKAFLRVSNDPTFKDYLFDTNGYVFNTLSNIEDGLLTRQIYNLEPKTEYLYKLMIEELGSLHQNNEMTNVDDVSLLEGTTYNGYCGEVFGTDFITSHELIDMLEINKDDYSLTFDSPNWLKLYSRGKEVLVPKKPLAYNFNIEDFIIKNNLHDGSKILNINNQAYKLRLFETNPDNQIDDEYVNLILPLHRKSRYNDWEYPDDIPDNIESWMINFSNNDFGINQPNKGESTLIWDGNSFKRRGSYLYSRESTSPERLRTDLNTTSNSSSFGWRPVLEKV